MTEKIKHLHRAEFDSIIRNGTDLIIFFYKEGDAASTLGIESMEEVNHLIGKSFELYFVNTESEPDITQAFSVKNVPEYISMKKTKIYKRSTNLLQPSEILALLK